MTRLPDPHATCGHHSRARVNKFRVRVHPYYTRSSEGRETTGEERRHKPGRKNADDAAVDEESRTELYVEFTYLP